MNKYDTIREHMKVMLTAGENRLKAYEANPNTDRLNSVFQAVGYVEGLCYVLYYHMDGHTDPELWAMRDRYCELHNKLIRLPVKRVGVKETSSDETSGVKQ